MEIVIDIPEMLYEKIQNRKADKRTLETVILRGTPLPEHHGRLIDADRLTRAEIMHLWYHLPNGDIACPKVDIDNAPTIIEADKGVLEKINEKQDSLRATCKAWDEAISRDGYVN